MRRQYVASIGVKFYAGIDERLEQPLIYQDLPVSVRGERILLFDGVADRGISLQYTSEYLTKYKGVQELATASCDRKLRPQAATASCDCHPTGQTQLCHHPRF